MCPWEDSEKGEGRDFPLGGQVKSFPGGVADMMLNTTLHSTPEGRELLYGSYTITLRQLYDYPTIPILVGGLSEFSLSRLHPQCVGDKRS
jgi:hypothetical protein